MEASLKLTEAALAKDIKNLRDLDAGKLLQRRSSASGMRTTKGTPFVNSMGMEFVPVEIPNGPTKGKQILFSIRETRVKDYAAFVHSTKKEIRA